MVLVLPFSLRKGEKKERIVISLEICHLSSPKLFIPALPPNKVGGIGAPEKQNNWLLLYINLSPQVYPLDTMNREAEKAEEPEENKEGLSFNLPVRTL